MPTYEFRLPDGTIIERTFKISEVPEEIPNPHGEGTAVRIISGGGALLFKGSGFYLTDYGRNAHRTQGEANKSAAGEGKGKSESGAPAAGGEGKSSGGDSKPSGGEGKSSGGDSKPSGGESKGSTTEAKSAPAPKSDPKPSSSGPAAP